MKKIWQTLQIGLLGIIFLTGCEIMKTALTTEDFINQSEEKDFITTDVKENQFQEYDFIKHAIIAQHPNGWQIEFYELTDTKEAKNMFKKNQQTFLKKEEESTIKTKVEVGNYTKYIQENKDEYMALTRVDNTLLYVDVKIEYKEEVEQYIKDLGY